MIAQNKPQYNVSIANDLLKLLEEIIPTLPRHQQIGVNIAVNEMLKKHQVPEQAETKPKKTKATTKTKKK